MADIKINLQTTRNAIATANNISLDLNQNQFYIVAGEINATTFEIAYDDVYFAGYEFYVEMVNSKGYGIPRAKIENKTFVLPSGMAVAGYGIISISAEQGDTRINFIPVKVPVHNTLPDWKDDISSTTQVYINDGYLMLVDDNGTVHNLGFVQGQDVLEYLEIPQEGYPSSLKLDKFNRKPVEGELLYFMFQYDTGSMYFAQAEITYVRTDSVDIDVKYTHKIDGKNGASVFLTIENVEPVGTVLVSNIRNYSGREIQAGDILISETNYMLGIVADVVGTPSNRTAQLNPTTFSVKGASAGFGTPTARVNPVEYYSDKHVSISTSGPDTKKVFSFVFNEPESYISLPIDSISLDSRSAYNKFGYELIKAWNIIESKPLKIVDDSSGMPVTYTIIGTAQSDKIFYMSFESGDGVRYILVIDDVNGTMTITRESATPPEDGWVSVYSLLNDKYHSSFAITEDMLIDYTTGAQRTHVAFRLRPNLNNHVKWTSNIFDISEEITATGKNGAPNYVLTYAGEVFVDNYSYHIAINWEPWYYNAGYAAIESDAVSIIDTYGLEINIW